MKCPPTSQQEAERLIALSKYGLGRDRPLPSLDSVVSIAARMFGVPVAAVNLVGNDHVFFAAARGINAAEVDMGRDASFCAHAMLQSDVMVVPDATRDDRFHDNPLVTGVTHLRFYAGVPILSTDGLPLGALCIIDQKPNYDFSDDDEERLRDLAKMAADRLELRRIEIAMEIEASKKNVIDASSPTAMIRFDEHGRVVNWNASAAALYRYDIDDWSTLTIEMLSPERDWECLHTLIAQAIKQGSVDGLTMPSHVHGLCSDGSEFLLGISLFCWREDDQLTFSAHLQDLSGSHNPRMSGRMIDTDVLTGAASRASFYQETEQVLEAARSAAVLILDLDGFKDINDELGHTAGDQVLVEVVRRMKEVIDANDTVARIGADEFAVLASGPNVPEYGRSIAEQISATIAVPMQIDGFEVRVTACVGVALAPEHGQEALEVIGAADLAVRKAKRTGRGHTFIYTPALRMETVAKRLYNIELQRAVSDGEFLLFYQPQVHLATGKLTGAEALIRWRHPQRGLLSPAAFLPSLEQGPLASTVGAWVLDEACAQAAFWRRNGLPELRMGINIFGIQFRVGHLVDDVLEALRRHGLPPQAIELEITENIALDDDNVLNAIERLREHHVGIAFDDFGTGYASLSLLKRYPLTRLKIDRSFVLGMTKSDRDVSVIQAILNMAQSFDLDTTAEGIETAEQINTLRRLGCSEGQGYFFAAPLPAREFTQRFATERRYSAIACA